MLLPSLSAVLLGMILIAAGRTRGQRHRGGPRHVLQRFDVPTRWLTVVLLCDEEGLREGSLQSHVPDRLGGVLPDKGRYLKLQTEGEGR